MDKLKPKLAFESLYLQAYGSRRKIERFSRMPKTKLLGYRTEYF
jgi:hypothetical protein